MSKMKSFSGLADSILADPARRANVERERREALAEIAEYNLAELRKAMDVTQVALAAELGCGQSEISRMENGDDPRLSTLREFIEGIGGHLETYAVFDDGSVRLRIGTERVDDVDELIVHVRRPAATSSQRVPTLRSVRMTERTGKKAATAASKTMTSKSAAKAAKSASGSALSQRKTTKVTRSKAASAAGKTLRSTTASKPAKSAAASALTQKPSKGRSKKK